MNTVSFITIGRKKMLLCLVLCFLAMLCAYADTDLEQALNAHDAEAVANVLSAATAEQSAEYESAVLEAARKAIMANDLAYASQLAETVLLANFDNADAQQMYTSIQDSLREQAEIERKAAEKKAEQDRYAEEQRLAEERRAAELRAEQQKEEYLQKVQVIGKDNFPCGISLSPLAFDFAKSPFADDFNGDSQFNCRYGFGGNIYAAFVHPYIKAKLSASFMYTPINVSGEGNKTDIDALVSIGMPSFTKVFALCVGYRRYATDGDLTALYPAFAGPFLGLGVDDLTLFRNFKLSFFAAWNMAPLVEKSEIDFAFDSKLTLKYSVAINDRLAWYIENATTFDGLVILEDLEWTAHTAFSVGVSINEN